MIFSFFSLYFLLPTGGHTLKEKRSFDFLFCTKKKKNLIMIWDGKYNLYKRYFIIISTYNIMTVKSFSISLTTNSHIITPIPIFFTYIYTLFILLFFFFCSYVCIIFFVLSFFPIFIAGQKKNKIIEHIHVFLF